MDHYAGGGVELHLNRGRPYLFLGTHRDRSRRQIFTAAAGHEVTGLRWHRSRVIGIEEEPLQEVHLPTPRDLRPLEPFFAVAEPFVVDDWLGEDDEQDAERRGRCLLRVKVLQKAIELPENYDNRSYGSASSLGAGEVWDHALEGLCVVVMAQSAPAAVRV